MFVGASGKYTELVLVESVLDPVGSRIVISRLDLMQQVTYSMKIWLADSLLVRILLISLGARCLLNLFADLSVMGRMVRNVRNYFDSVHIVHRNTGSLFQITKESTMHTNTLTTGTGIAGVALFYQASEQRQVITLGVVFHTCSVTLNIIATGFIAGRLMYQRKLVKALGGEHSKEYLSASAIFAESGALYSISGLIYIPLYGINSPLIYVFAAPLEAAAVSLRILLCDNYQATVHS